jgi:thiol-disulfide isomerase/thioredoxin
MNSTTMGLIFVLAILGVLPLSSSAHATEETDTAAWGNAPDFSMTTFAGEELQLSDYAGQPMLLNFWAEWCPPCVAELPLLEQAWEDYGAEVAFMTINLEKGRMDPAAFLAERDLQIPGSLAANEVAAQYGISGIPATFFISSEGNVLGVKTGPFTEGELPHILDAFLAYEKSLTETP